MKNKLVNIIITLIGVIGMLVMTIMSIEEKNYDSIISAIPATILFASLFIVGYISLSKNEK